MNSISDVWQSVLSRLQEQLSETTIRTWFDEVDVVTMEDSAFVLHCSNSFKKSTIETRFMKHIKAALKDIFSSDLEVKFRRLHLRDICGGASEQAGLCGGTGRGG